jgi:2,3-bisphosphoglycerate-independent phosphoglycerate mutase
MTHENKPVPGGHQETGKITTIDGHDCTPLMRDLAIVVDGLADGSVSKIEVVTWLHAHAAHNLRNYFAASALQGFIAAGSPHGADYVAYHSIAHADAMLRVINGQGGVL